MVYKAYMGVSVDGYIADSNNSLEWLNRISNPEESDFGFADFMDSIDAVLMGRNTYETVLSFGNWPYQKPVFVLSTTLTQIPQQLRGKVELLTGPPRQIVVMLHERGHEDIYVDGGKVVQCFLSERLLDELTLTRIPILLGGGVSLFGNLEVPIELNHEETTIFDNGLVKSRYTILHD